MEKHRKSENAPDAKLAPLHIAIQDTDKAGWQYHENLLCSWLEKNIVDFSAKPP